VETSHNLLNNNLFIIQESCYSLTQFEVWSWHQPGRTAEIEDQSLENIHSSSLKRRPFKYDAGTLTPSVRNRGRQRKREMGQTNYVTLMSECCVGPEQDSLAWVVGRREASDIMPMFSECYGRLAKRICQIAFCNVCYVPYLRTTVAGHTTLQGLSRTNQEPARYPSVCLNSYFRSSDQF
jgi:hypothetical protein